VFFRDVILNLKGRNFLYIVEQKVRTLATKGHKNGSYLQQQVTFFMQSHVYILFSLKLIKYYVGSTNDLQRRLAEHNRGKEKFTKTGLPWLLVYSEAFEQITATRKRELEIKKEKSRIYIESIIRSIG
jgi:putative endonuclease